MELGQDSDYEQLMKLRALTKKSGALHEAQVYQLKMWPLLLTHATKTKISVDFNSKHVIYDIIETKGRKPEKLQNKLKLLGFYTKVLLGEEYKVTVKIKKKAVYRVKGD